MVEEIDARTVNPYFFLIAEDNANQYHFCLNDFTVLAAYWEKFKYALNKKAFAKAIKMYHNKRLNLDRVVSCEER